MKFHRLRLTAAGVAVATLLSGCGGGDATAANDIEGAVTSGGISSDRCEANKKAGEITYLTGFDFAAAAGIIDAVVADELGYFEKMCLNVKVQSGFDTQNIPLVSAGRAQVTALGSMSEIADAQAKDGNIEAVGMLGHTAVEALAVSDKAGIGDVAAVRGSTMGVVGTIPFSIRVMLTRAGVPLDSIKQVEAGFNPLALDQGTFASRPVYKSNEPRQLDAAGVRYRLFDPTAQDIDASFGVITVNKDFAREHPSAVEDLLRAQLKGLEYAMANPDAAVDLTYKKADPKYYLSLDGERFRWSTEMRLVQESTADAKVYGYIDADEVRAEIEPLVNEVKSLPVLPELDTLYDARFIERIYDGNTLIWPAAS
jgi:ABC-type nitrate/sulfonate/bicarbonate transport system substrate-binding protein